MEYGTLIRQAWAITWRYRFLWFLGVLAGGAVGIPSFGSGGGSRSAQQQPGAANTNVAAAMETTAAWAAQNVGLLIGAASLLAVLLLVLLVVSFIAQGSMAQATAQLASGHVISLGSAWGAGVHLFWRYVGLFFACVAAAVLVAALTSAIVAAAVTASAVSQGPGPGLAIAGVAAVALIVAFVAVVLRLTETTHVPRWLVALGATLFALPIFTVVIAVGLTVSIVVAFAQRAIAVEDVGPLVALKSGWRLTRSHLGDSLLTWLVNLGLALGAGVAIVMALLGALLLLGGIGALLFAVAGFTAPTVVYIGFGGIVFIAAVLTLAGIANAFFWTYWTLAYLRLTGRATAAAA